MKDTTLAYAYVHDGMVSYNFTALSFLRSFQVNASLGQCLMNFIWLPADDEQNIFALAHSILNGCSTIEDCERKMDDQFLVLAKKTPFLYFYLDIFICLSFYRDEAHSICKQVQDRLGCIPPGGKHIKDLIPGLTNYLQTTQVALKKELESILDECAGLNSFTGLQKLYLMTLATDKPKAYLKATTFQTCLKPLGDFEPLTYSEAVDSFKNSDTKVVEMYKLNTFSELFSFELIQLLNHNITIKRCKCCNEFFIPTNYSNTEYCDRIVRPNTKRCKEIGALKTFNNKHANDPIYSAYRTAYRRLDSRKRQKMMSEKEFFAWSTEASMKRDACMRGELSFEDFQAWLDQSRVRTK